MDDAPERNELRRFLELYAEADLEVRRRLRRQPALKPQFARGVHVSLRWLREALAARVGQESMANLFPPDQEDPGL